MKKNVLSLLLMLISLTFCQIWAKDGKIKLGKYIQYHGTLENKKPYGKGNLYLYSPQDKKNPITTISGSFNQFNVLDASVNINNVLLFSGNVLLEFKQQKDSDLLIITLKEGLYSLSNGAKEMESTNKNDIVRVVIKYKEKKVATDYPQTISVHQDTVTYVSQNLTGYVKKSGYLRKKVVLKDGYEYECYEENLPITYAISLRDKEGSEYVGEYKDGKDNQSGEIKYSNGDYVKGTFNVASDSPLSDWKFIKAEGTYTKNGAIFEGSWINDSFFEGESSLVNETDTIIGTWKSGIIYNGYASGRIGEDHYKGRWNNGYFDGTVIYSSGDTYVGSLYGFQKSGHGVIALGLEKYEGEFRDDKYEGYGIYYWPSGSHYEGNWHNGVRHGQGKMTDADGSRYEGEFRDDKYEGYGIYYWPSGSHYEGNWHNGVRHGQGKMTDANGYRYEGEFRDDKYDGYGILYWPEGHRYDGNWHNGNRHGQGKMISYDGSCYEGEFLNDKPEGYGIYYWSDGSRYEGNWHNGIRKGQGKMTDADGSYTTGEWTDGKLTKVIEKGYPEGSFKRLRNVYDEFESTNYYYNSIFEHKKLSERFSIFIKESNGRYSFYCKASTDDEPESLYLSKNAILLCDGQTVRLTVENWGDDKHEGFFYESYSWFEYPMTKEVREFLSRIRKESKVKLRVYTSDRTRDRELSSSEVEAIVEMMNVIKSNFRF